MASSTTYAPCPRCGLPLPPAGVCAGCLLQGEEPFELLEELGRGGMGTVWRARHRGLDREVAVKFLADRHLDDPDMRARFEREARLLARVDHPGVVRVHHVDGEAEPPYLVMELVEGRALSEGLPLPPERATELIVQACEAVAAIHAAGLVHRDIKPDNLVLDQEGRVRVVDFGIARSLDPTATRLTRHGHLTGTPAYLPPEVYKGAEPHPRQDLYALGASLVELLTGQPPAGLLPPLPPSLRAVVERALAPADERYQEASALRDDLGRALETLRGDDLPDEERTWHRVAALGLTACSGVVLAAALSSLSPKVLQPHEVRPLVMFALEPLADGRMVSRVRFEEGPMLAAIAAVAAGVALWALLFRHWRKAGLLAVARGPLPQGRQLLAWGAFACGVFAVHRTFLEQLGALVALIPLVGGLIEIVALWLFWSGVLEARRTARPLARQWSLWAGLGLALVPPTFHFVRHLATWAP